MSLDNFELLREIAIALYQPHMTLVAIQLKVHKSHATAKKAS